VQGSLVCVSMLFATAKMRCHGDKPCAAPVFVTSPQRAVARSVGMRGVGQVAKRSEMKAKAR